MQTAYIVDHVRTPRSKRKGKYSTVHPVDLLTYPLRAIVERNKLNPEAIEDLVLGCVTQTGEQGWCVARKGVLAAGWPISVPATTVNRLCGSGQQATNFVASGIQGGTYDLAVSGGLEHMTRCAMFSDISGEESPMLVKRFSDLVQQGEAAEILSAEYKVSRVDADTYSVESHRRAAIAQREGRFARSLVPVSYHDENGKELQLTADDNVRPDSSVEKLQTLKTVFRPDGIITAGNASAIVDGAGVVLLASERALKQHNLKPRARIVTTASIGSPPRIMLTGPIAVSELALKRAGLKKGQIDLWEINEAFAPVPIVTTRQLGIDPSIVNVNGGGIALGHPLGATGAMLLGTALDELERSGKQRALVTMCIGIGMGIATIIERV